MNIPFYNVKVSIKNMVLFTLTVEQPGWSEFYQVMDLTFLFFRLYYNVASS